MVTEEQDRGQLSAELEATRARLKEALQLLDAFRRGRLDTNVEQPGSLETRDVSALLFRDQAVFDQYHMLLDSIAEGAVMIVPDGKIAYCNAAFASAVGKRLEEVAGADFRDFLAPADALRFGALLDRARHAAAREKMNLTAADGSHLAVRLALRFTHLGDLECACLIVTEVTEPERTEERIGNLNTELERRVAQLIEASVDALLTIDPEFRITDANERMTQLSGFSREELIGAQFPSLAEAPERALKCMQRALSQGLVRDFQINLGHKSGGRVPVAISARTFKDSAGRNLGVFVALHDITEWRVLDRERSLLASIVASSPDAIYSIAPDTAIISWNAGAEKLFGYKAKEMIGRSAAILVPPEQRAEMLEHLDHVLHNQGVAQYETVRRRRDGSRVDISITMSPITDNAGSVRAVAVIGRDLTERKRFELELTKARDEALAGVRARSEFLANMSHEIRTPLTSIIGMTDIVLDGALADEQRRRLELVRDNAGNLLTIVNDILDFSKLAAGQLPSQNIDFDLEQIVDRTLRPFAEAAQRRGLEVIASIDPHTPRMLCGESDRLRQVLVNLLGNAVKFTEHGEIVLRVSKVEESPSAATLRFEVCDSGIGITREAQERLFRPFAQADAAIALAYGGTGLGLAIASQLVQRMGGSIGVTSTPGAGSTFWFTAKFTTQPGATRQRLPDAINLEGVRTLIVDDNSVNREVLSAQFRSWNLAPDTAAGPGEALEMMRREAQRGHPYALAVLDLEMPEMDGIELARQIRRRQDIAATELIILSSAGNPAHLSVLTAELGLHAFLLKPVKQSQLLDCVAGALGRSQAAALPPREASEGPQADPGPEPLIGPHGRPLRVLLAEDNAANRDVALWQLRKLGCLVDAVASGHQALEAAAGTSYDVILMDCRMPQMDGYQATREIRQREASTTHTRIVAMTAHALSGDQEKCLGAGMDDYLSKPVTLESLAATLRRVMSMGAGGLSPAPPAAIEPAAAVQAPVLDPAMMASLRAKGDLLPGLIDTVVAEVPEQLKQIADALAGRNHADAAIAAHSLKGTAKIFGAGRMAELAAALEQAADAQAMEKAATQLQSLKRECEQVLRELETERARRPGDASGAV